jgi:phosphomethylpyrimidine synthase
MLTNEAENPFYSEFNYLLEIAREYDVTISLGDGMRPGCIADANDDAMFQEAITLGRLVRQTRAAGVQCMVEGPGHVPVDGIGYGVRTIKHLCDDAPLYLLGPVVTDLAPGYLPSTLRSRRSRMSRRARSSQRSRHMQSISQS